MSLESFENPDPHRPHLRDRARDAFGSNQVDPETNEPKWFELINQAVSQDHRALQVKLQDPTAQTIEPGALDESMRITPLQRAMREDAASRAMRARLLMKHLFSQHEPFWSNKFNPAEDLRHAMRQLQLDGKEPDQYEINFSALRAIAEVQARDTTYGGGLLLAARSAILACASESKFFARETNPNLKFSDRLKAKARALGRAGMAGAVAATNGRILDTNIGKKIMVKAF